MLRSTLFLVLLAAACASRTTVDNPSPGEVLTLVAQAQGGATQTIPPPYFSYEEESYADQVSHSTGNVVTALDDFIAHIAQVDVEPNLLNDETWLADLQSLLDELDHTSVRVSTITPIPKIFVDLNPKMLALGEAITKLVDDYSEYAYNNVEASGELTEANIDAVRLLLHEVAVQLRDITFEAFNQ
jgi:hypothetical protein